jgi:hypothetical protein
MNASPTIRRTQPRRIKRNPTTGAPRFRMNSSQAERGRTLRNVRRNGR